MGCHTSDLAAPVGTEPAEPTERSTSKVVYSAVNVPSDADEDVAVHAQKVQSTRETTPAVVKEPNTSPADKTPKTPQTRILRPAEPSTDVPEPSTDIQERSIEQPEPSTDGGGEEDEVLQFSFDYESDDEENLVEEGRLGTSIGLPKLPSLRQELDALLPANKRKHKTGRAMPATDAVQALREHVHSYSTALVKDTYGGSSVRLCWHWLFKWAGVGPRWGAADTFTGETANEVCVYNGHPVQLSLLDRMELCLQKLASKRLQSSDKGLYDGGRWSAEQCVAIKKHWVDIMKNADKKVVDLQNLPKLEQLMRQRIALIGAVKVGMYPPPVVVGADGQPARATQSTAQRPRFNRFGSNMFDNVAGRSDQKSGSPLSDADLYLPRSRPEEKDTVFYCPWPRSAMLDLIHLKAPVKTSGGSEDKDTKSEVSSLAPFDYYSMLTSIGASSFQTGSHHLLMSPRAKQAAKKERGFLRYSVDFGSDTALSGDHGLDAGGWGGSFVLLDRFSDAVLPDARAKTERVAHAKQEAERSRIVDVDDDMKSLNRWLEQMETRLGEVFKQSFSRSQQSKESKSTA